MDRCRDLAEGGICWGASGVILLRAQDARSPRALRPAVSPNPRADPQEALANPPNRQGCSFCRAVSHRPRAVGLDLHGRGPLSSGQELSIGAVRSDRETSPRSH